MENKIGKDPQNRERISPIVSKDKIVSTKKPLGKKISEKFLTADARDIKNWLLLDVLIPELKNIALDTLKMIFWGDVDRRSYTDRKRDRWRTNYRSYYDDYSSEYRGSRDSRRRRDEYDSDDKIDFRHIVLTNRIDAEKIVDELRRRIADEGDVSIAVLLDLIDVPGRYTDWDWGWDDERDIGIRRISSGFLIDVSEPKYIKR